MFYSITTTWKWKVMVVNQIIQYIELHLEDGLSIKQLADVAMKYGWKSHSAFSKSFNREFVFRHRFLEQ